MEIDGRDERLDFIGIDGVIKAKCCPNCFTFSEGDYCRYTVNGESEAIVGEDTGEEEDVVTSSASKASLDIAKQGAVRSS